ncbi:MAG: hypothetical protein ACRD4G_09120, partial [Bryobacteraceae bacterium]
AILLAGCILAWAWLRPWIHKLSQSMLWSMLFLATLPLLLRLALLVHCPVPIPTGSDGFGYVLLGDTLAHFRLANPPHALSRFFETPFILQQPTYSSIYPLGQGIALAIGELVFGIQWAGVLLSVSALCALCYWMLRGWVAPPWAFLGGLLSVVEFGPLSYWTNSYWGGAVTACGGCLVFGSLPRLRETGHWRYGALLGAGFAISILTRPFESIFLVIGAGLYFVIATPAKVRLLARAVPIICLATLPGIVLTLAQDKAVTGSWTTLPYQLSRYEYGVPTTFTFQPNPTPHHKLSHQEKIDYEAQTLVHGDGHDTPAGYWHRLVRRIRFYRFFLLAPLYIAFAVFLITAFRSRTALWVLAVLVLFALGTTFYPYFYPHYIAAEACLFLLAAIMGLERINARYIVQAIVIVCAAHFLFWYGLHLTAGIDTAASMNKYDSWDYIDFGDPEGRFAIAHRLATLPGKQLVFVHYGPRHMFHDWIHNAADIDRAHVVWARDLGASENRELLQYFPRRTAWMFDPDVWPPSLKPYRSE